MPEDRKTEGLMLPMSVADNLSVAALDGMRRGGLIDREKERGAVDDLLARLKIRSATGTDAGGRLSSGGNQQRSCIAEWLLTKPRIILLNDPTRGIDVGTEQELYRLIANSPTKARPSCSMSTDYDEFIGCCDRMAIMYEGRVVRELSGADLTETNIVESSLDIDSRQRASASLGEAAHV